MFRDISDLFIFVRIMYTSRRVAELPPGDSRDHDSDSDSETEEFLRIRETSDSAHYCINDAFGLVSNRHSRYTSYLHSYE